MYIFQDTLAWIYICIGIICEADRSSHGPNQTLIEQSHSSLAPDLKNMVLATGLNNQYVKFDPQVASLIAQSQTHEYVLRSQMNKRDKSK